MPPISVWVNGLLIGATIVMMASGLVLAFSVMGIMNWCHGQLYMIGAFVVYFVCVKLHMNYFIALLLAAIVVTVIGVAIERWLQRPLSGAFLQATVVSLGMIFVLEGVVVAIFGTDLKSVPTILEGVLRLGPVAISLERAVLAGLALAVMVGLYLFINRTKTGLAIRAAAQLPTVAGLYGAQSGRLFTVVMAIGSALAALAGGMMAPVYFVDPWIGGKPLFTALLAIVIGGLGSFKGAVVGGLILGFVASVVSYWVGPWSEMISFLAVILIVLFMPQGLFGQAEARA